MTAGCDWRGLQHLALSLDVRQEQRVRPSYRGQQGPRLDVHQVLKGVDARAVDEVRSALKLDKTISQSVEEQEEEHSGSLRHALLWRHYKTCRTLQAREPRARRQGQTTDGCREQAGVQ